MGYKEGSLSWVYGNILRDYFASDPEHMARELGVPDAWLQTALHVWDSKEVLLIFEPFLRYCVEHKIDLNALLKRFLAGDIDE